MGPDTLLAKKCGRHSHLIVPAAFFAALKTLEGPLPDLLLTNVYFPGLTGHEAMHLFKERCPGLKVLMVSGLPNGDVIQKWTGEDGFDVFPKPFTAQALIAKVRQTIDKSSRTEIAAD